MGAATEGRGWPHSSSQCRRAGYSVLVGVGGGDCQDQLSVPCWRCCGLLAVAVVTEACDAVLLDCLMSGGKTAVPSIHTRPVCPPTDDPAWETGRQGSSKQRPTARTPSPRDARDGGGAFDHGAVGGLQTMTPPRRWHLEFSRLSHLPHDLERYTRAEHPPAPTCWSLPLGQAARKTRRRSYSAATVMRCHTPRSAFQISKLASRRWRDSRRAKM